MFNNCTENGYLFSCFQNFGPLNNSFECKKKCNANYFTQIGLNDFYNFAERLNESNFLIRHGNKTEYPMYDKRICKYPFRNCKILIETARNISAFDANLCTQIKFDFPTRTWMDKTAFVTNDFEKKWSKKECFPTAFVLDRDFFSESS